MAKSRKNSPKQPSVKVRDMEPAKDPKGGYSKISIEYQPTTTTTTKKTS